MRYINLLITYLLAYYGSLHPRVAGGPENLCHTQPVDCKAAY